MKTNVECFFDSFEQTRRPEKRRPKLRQNSPTATGPAARDTSCLVRMDDDDVAATDPCTQSECPAQKELLKQRIQYQLCDNDDGTMEWHGGVVKKKYKNQPGWYSCALDDGTAVVLLFENSNRDNVWRIVKPAAQPAAKPMIAFATAPSSPRASPSAAAKPSDVPAFDAIAMSPVSRAVTASEAATAPKIMPPGTLGSSTLQQNHVVLLEGEGRFWSALQAQEAPDPPTPPSTAICASRIWHDRVCADDQSRSVLHPAIKQKIGELVQAKRLSWPFLLQDRFMAEAAALATPPTVSILWCVIIAPAPPTDSPCCVLTRLAACSALRFVLAACSISPTVE